MNKPWSPDYSLKIKVEIETIEEWVYIYVRFLCAMLITFISRDEHGTLKSNYVNDRNVKAGKKEK